jgi:pyruvyl transferase EpsO
MPHPIAGTVDVAVQRLRAVLDPLVPQGSRVALLDFPMYSNVGDSAIWAGELSYLRDREARVVYRSTWHTHHGPTLRRLLGPDGIVLLTGGGNFGDLYARHQRLRRRVFEELGDRRIVQLPQTVNFSSDRALDEFAAAHGHLDGLVVLVRDEQSRDLLTGVLARDPVLAPDMAFALGPLERGAASQDVLALLRTDHETAGHRDDAHVRGLQPLDWLDERRDGGGPWDRVVDTLGRGQRLMPGASARAGGVVLGRALDQRALREVRRGTALLSRGRVVVTDRLHAHLLATLLGIPQVVLADRHDKVRRASALWVGEHRWIRHAATVEQAAVEAEALLSGSG